MGTTTTFILWTIPLTMILTTYATLQWFPTTTSSFLISMRFLSCIESLIRNYIFFLTCILRSSSLWWSFSFIFLISFQVMVMLNFALRLLITMLQLSDGLFQRFRLIELNPVSVCNWQSTDESLNLGLLLLEVRHISQQLQKPASILIICHRNHQQLIKILSSVIIVPHRQVILLEEPFKCMPSQIFLRYTFDILHVFPPNICFTFKTESGYICFHVF